MLEGWTVALQPRCIYLLTIQRLTTIIFETVCSFDPEAGLYPRCARLASIPWLHAGKKTTNMRMKK